MKEEIFEKVVKFEEYEVKPIDLVWLCIYLLITSLVNMIWVGIIGFLFYMLLVKLSIYKKVYWRKKYGN